MCKTLILRTNLNLYVLTDPPDEKNGKEAPLLRDTIVHYGERLTVDMRPALRALYGSETQEVTSTASAV